MQASTILIVSTISFVAAGAAAGNAQPRTQPAHADIEERIEVTEVLLDVLVTDRKGRVIIGLRPADFIVEEEGEPVEIISASFYSNRRNLDDATSGTEPVPTPMPRYFIFFFHDQTRNDPSQRSRQTWASRDSRKWIRTKMLPSDLAAVASFDVKLKIHQDFTGDRDALIRAVERAAIGKDPGGNWPSRLPTTTGAATAPSLLAVLPKGNDLRKETTIFADAVRVLATATKSIRARKTLFLFSQGFAGLDSSGGWRPDPRYYPPMMQALNDSNVAVYALDLAPLGSEHSRRDSLHLLASDTGGRLYDKVLSFAHPLGIIADENSGYYLLSYRSRSPQDESGYRRVKVSLRNKELRVRGRQGFLFGQG